MYITNNIFQTVFPIIRDIIKNNVIDINSERRNKNGNWIFDEAPLKFDDYYPRITITNTDYSIEDYCDNNLVYENSDEIVQAQIVNATIKITVFVKKGQLHTITENNQTTYLKNKKQAHHLVNKIIRALILNRDKLLEKNIDFAPQQRIFDISSVYDDNQYLWAIDIRFTIQGMENIVTEYESSDLINDTNLNVI